MGARSFSEVIKDQPGADAVHVASAGGDGAGSKRKTARTFREVVAGCAPGELEKAEAKPLYVHRKVTNAQDLIDWAKSNGFETTVPADDMHTTVVYSKKAMDWSAAGDHFDHLRFTGGDGRSVEKFGDAAVLRYAAPELQDRHKQFMAAGASHDFPEFNPHVTLSWKAPADLDASKIEPYAGPIELGPEVYGDIKSDWKDNLVEKHFGFAEDPQHARVCKVDEGLGLVFGFAIVCKIDGEDYYDLNIDPDGQRVPEHIPEDAMLKASADFMANAERPGNEMHRGPDSGEFVFAFPLTSDIAKALGIATQKTGLLVGYKPEPHVLAKYKSGEYTGFSIEGVRIHNEELPK